MNALQIKQLVKTYANGTTALKGVDLRIEAGDFFALLGANGAGKTTLIGILTGLINRTSGDVKIFDVDSALKPATTRMFLGVVPQEFNFNVFEKVQDIIVNQAGYFGIPRPKALADSERILKRLELWDKRSQPSRNLSGGMKRRLMIARALINNPRLLILDEPTAGVDVELRHGMWEFLRELNRQGTTILLTTHYLEEVEQMCRNAAIIKNGEIIKCDLVKNMVRLIDRETYVVHAQSAEAARQLIEYNPVILDDSTFEIELTKTESLNNFIAQLTNAGIKIMDIRPKGNRLEKLFLKLLK